MEPNNKVPAASPVELNTAHISSRAEAPSSSLDEKCRSEEAVGLADQDSPFYVKGWRLHTLSLRFAFVHCPCVKLTVIAP